MEYSAGQRPVWGVGETRLDEEAGPKSHKALTALLRHPCFILRERGIAKVLMVLGLGDETGSVV